MKRQLNQKRKYLLMGMILTKRVERNSEVRRVNMQLHFYTALSNIKKIQNGEPSRVWNKVEASSTDVHISIDEERYLVDRVSDTVFKVRKMTWIVE